MGAYKVELSVGKDHSAVLESLVFRTVRLINELNSFLYREEIDCSSRMDQMDS